MRPQISDSVHYVHPGSGRCGHAVITHVGDETEPYTVDLNATDATDINYCQLPKEGTWHYAHDMDHLTAPPAGAVTA